MLSVISLGDCFILIFVLGDTVPVRRHALCFKGDAFTICGETAMSAGCRREHVPSGSAEMSNMQGPDVIDYPCTNVLLRTAKSSFPARRHCCKHTHELKFCGGSVMHLHVIGSLVGSKRSLTRLTASTLVSCSLHGSSTCAIVHAC